MEFAQLLLVGAVAVTLAVVTVALLWLILARRRRPAARRIVVIGIGGGGGNAVDRMVAARMWGVEFIACNTDEQVLRRSRAPRKIQIGDKLTGGLGAGGDPAIGRRAAEEDAERIARALAGADMVFITAGLGGGTGSGAAPVVAAQSREAGALTVGVVTRPFAFEGAKRREIADRAAEELGANVDTLIVIPNDGVRNVVLGELSMPEAFRIVDDILRLGIGGVVDIITEAGFINLDFADVRSVMKDAGSALMGVGRATGDKRATEAAHEAIGNPLLGASVAGARAILFNVAGPPELTLAEVTQVAEIVRAAADPDANVIFGASFDDQLADAVQVTVIATGFAPAKLAEDEGRPAGAERTAPRTRPAPALPARAPDRGSEAVAREPTAVPIGPAPEESIEVASSQASGPVPPEELDLPSFLRRQVSRSRERPRDPAD